VEKTYHSLGESDSNQFGGIPRPQAFKSRSAEEKKPSNQSMIEFEIDYPKPDEFDMLYNHPQPSPDEDYSVKIDFSGSDDDFVDKLENIPAYRRKNMKIDSNKEKYQNKMSRFSLSQDDDDKTFLRDNNSFLHDNVD
jgi:cell division protein FtsZ